MDVFMYNMESLAYLTPFYRALVQYGQARLHQASYTYDLYGMDIHPYYIRSIR